MLDQGARCKAAAWRLLLGAAALAVVGTPAGAEPARPHAELTELEATALVAPLYAALNAPTGDMIGPLLEQATAPEWQDCASNVGCEDRPSAIRHMRQRIVVTPGIKVDIKDVLVAGDRIVVRGEEHGTPAAAFLGLPPTGRSFRIMTIDIHDVRDGKLVRTHHVEDWALALRQLKSEAP